MLKQLIKRLNKNAPIGVVDSGVGGLTVLKHLREMLPKENFIFIGDTARTPYGTRSEAELRLFADEMITWLEHKGAKLIVFACNTMTMLGVNTLEKDHQLLLIGMSKGEQLLDIASRNRRVGVFATPYTIGTGAHRRAIAEIAPDILVYPMPCAKFVPLVEAERFGTEELKAAVHEYAVPLKEAGIDSLILSCTHYPFIQEEIAAEFGPAVKIVDPAKETALLAKKTLDVLGLRRLEGRGSITICCTADIARVERLTARILPTEKVKYQLINLEE